MRPFLYVWAAWVRYRNGNLETVTQEQLCRRNAPGAIGAAGRRTIHKEIVERPPALLARVQGREAANREPANRPRAGVKALARAKTGNEVARASGPTDRLDKEPTGIAGEEIGRIEGDRLTTEIVVSVSMVAAMDATARLGRGNVERFPPTGDRRTFRGGCEKKSSAPPLQIVRTRPSHFSRRPPAISQTNSSDLRIASC